MPTTLSIKDVPDSVADALRHRAARHHRSVNEETVDILKNAVGRTRSLTPVEFVAEVKAMGIATPDESAAIIREDRNRH